MQARAEFFKNNPTSPTQAFQNAYVEVLSEELEKISNQFDQAQALRQLMTSTAGISAPSATKAPTIKSDELAKMGLFIGGAAIRL